VGIISQFADEVKEILATTKTVCFQRLADLREYAQGCLSACEALRQTELHKQCREHTLLNTQGFLLFRQDRSRAKAFFQLEHTHELCQHVFVLAQSSAAPVRQAGRYSC
jgi:hypothetical protein